MSLVDAFINKLENFLRDLVIRFPNIPDLRTALNSVEVTKSIASKTILEKFMKALSPYYMQIFDKKDSFFFNLDLNQEIKIQDNSSKENYLKIACHLKSVWSSKLTNKEKQGIWQHFQVLLTLGSIASKEYYDHIITYAKMLDSKNKSEIDKLSHDHFTKQNYFLSIGGKINN